MVAMKAEIVSLADRQVPAPTRLPLSWKLVTTGLAVFAMALVVVSSNHYGKAPTVHSATTINGLVAAWDFEGVTGATVPDTSSNGNTATLSNASVSSGTLSMTGSNSYATVANSSSVGLTSNMTFSAWVNVKDFNNWRGIMGKTSSNIPNPYDWYLYNGSGKPTFLVGNGSSYNQFIGQNAPATGQWQHLAVVVSGTTVTQYLNGVINSSGTITAPRANAAANLYIGSRDDKVTQMNGSLDDVKMYNRALSETEVKSLADTPHTVQLTSAERDTQRKKDLEEIRQALELYYQKYTTYRVANSGWNGGGEGWVSYEDAGSYKRSVTRALSEEKDSKGASMLARVEYKDPQSTDPGYMIYICDGGKSFALSATLEAGTPVEKAAAEASCNGSGGNATVGRYGKNYSVGGPVVVIPTLAAGPIAQWNFDEGSGTTAANSVGSGNAGTLLGGATWVAGVNGKAVQLNGTDGYVDLGNATSLQPQQVSLSVWFKTDAAGMIFRKRLYGYGLEVLPTKQISFWTYDKDAAKFSAVSPNAYADNAWHHAVGVYDGSTVKLSIDGVSVATANAGAIFYGAGAIAVGRDGDHGGQYLKGLIDEVKLYNRALSIDEMIQSQGPVAEWHFDEGSGATAADSSGKNNTATLQGGVSWVDGVKAKAVQLDGKNGYLAKSYDAASPLFNITNKLTYELWVKPQKGIGVLIGRQQCNNAWPSAELGLGGTAPNFTIELILNYQHNNTYTVFTSPAVVPENQWSHIAATYDKDTKLVKIYRNGIEVFSGAYDKTLWKPPTSLWIGGIPKPEGAPTCWENYGNGSVDDVKIYNRALSAEEIASEIVASSPQTGGPNFTALGLMGEWKFDNGSLKDSKQNRDATNSGAVQAADHNNVPGYAYEFKNASKSYINAGVVDAYKATQAVTMEAWVYPTGMGDPTNGGIIVNREGEYEIARLPNGHIEYALANTAPGWFWIDTGYTAPLNTWMHLVLTYNSADKTVALYANGQEVYRNASTNGTIGDIATNFNEFRIGGRQAFDAQNFDGRIDTVRIYNTALSAANVASLYEAETAPPVVMQTQAQASFGSSSSSRMEAAQSMTMIVAPDIIATPDHLQFFASECGDAAHPCNSLMQQILLELSDGSIFRVKPLARSLNINNSLWLKEEQEVRVRTAP